MKLLFKNASMAILNMDLKEFSIRIEFFAHLQRNETQIFIKF